MRFSSYLPPNGIDFLKANLPFTLNALNSLRDYSDRTKIYYNKIRGNGIYIIKFDSGYNQHIWYSPIMWILTEKEDANILATTIKKLLERYSSFIALAKTVHRELDMPMVVVYKEKLMMNDKFDNLGVSEFKVIRLNENAAESSLLLSMPSYKENFSREHMIRERLFLRERETYGIFLENTLVCRGSIMSRFGNYYSVGGFITHADYRNMGLANSLIGFIFHKIQEHGGIVTLTVREDNFGAVSLYKRLGFREAEEVIFMNYGSDVVP